MTTRRYTKDDVETHGGHPAVNVKTYNFPSASEVESRFGCNEATAEEALEYAWHAAVERFWENIGETVEYVLGKGTRWTTAGRSGGSLTTMTRSAACANPQLSKGHRPLRKGPGSQNFPLEYRQSTICGELSESLT